MQIVCWLVLLSWPAASAPLPSGQRGNTRSPHGPLAIPCENCHVASGWKPIRAVPEFDHNKTRYPLRGLHEKVQCTQCHVKPVFTDVGKNCEECHADIHQRKMGTNCAQCHTVLGWNIATQQVKDHQNRFPLLGAHAAVQCEECHKGAAVGQFQGLSTACVSCHLRELQQTQSIGGSVPNHVTGNFPRTCENCHNADSWLATSFNGTTFDHAGPPINFPLTNGHANVACTACHLNNNYNLQIQALDCGNAQCHLTTWQTTNNPTHSTAGAPFAAANCSGCHNTISWTTAVFDHSTTGFALTGTHASPSPTPCASCHVSNNYTLNSNDCMGCHLAAWQSTPTFGGNVPDHIKAGFPSTAAACAQCHPITKWADGTFDHAAFGFPLTNSHALVANGGKVPSCASCHINNNYSLSIMPNDCGNSGCHLTTWQTTNNPVHSTSGPTFAVANCATCHNTISWTGAVFDHSTTGFPLTNSHQMAPAGKVAACTDCHINNNYTLTITPTDCGNSGCHLTTWQTTNNPVHPTAGAPFAAANCSTCHNTITWTTATFDHSTTGWALTGSHQMVPAGKVVACTDCHVGNNYTFTVANTDCYGCHLTAWQSTTTLGGIVPNHIAAGFPTSQCSTCHNTTTWTSTFNHATTGFPLTNSHQMAPAGKAVACTDCHINNNYTLTITPNDCGNSGCHLTTWQTTNNPTHPTAGAPFAAANCSTCHSTITWTTATFNHSTTGWALTGSHQMAPAGKVVACTDCHVGNNYTFTVANTDCYGCHLTAWLSTQTLGGAVPNHITSGFPTSQCSTCHDTLVWSTGKFDHSTTGWALQGAHVTTPCASCHMGASPFSLTAANTDCYGCHQAAWLSTQTLGGQVPNHIAAQFATTCVTCHTTWVTTGWLGATLTAAQHTWFRIPHNGSVCSDCHLVSTDYATFSCINCHTRTAHQPGMSHPNVNGGNWYGATTCYNCHKN